MSEAAEHAFEANHRLKLPRGLVLPPTVQYYGNSGRSSHSAVVAMSTCHINNLVDALLLAVERVPRRLLRGRC